MRRIFLLLIVALLGFATSFAQEDGSRYNEVTLKNGHRVTGNIVEYKTDNYLRIVKQAGDTVTIMLSDVEIVRTKNRPQVSFGGGFGSKGLQKGYYGDVYYDVVYGSMKKAFQRLKFSTVHGYQFLPYLRLGAGLEYFRYTQEYRIDEKNVTDHTNLFILFADARCHFTKSAISPYFDLRAGYGLNKHSKFYISPTLGVRFGLKQGTPLAINTELGIEWLNPETSPGVYEKEAGFVLRLGFEF